MENKPKIRTYDDPRLMNLKRAAYSNNVVKGFKGDCSSYQSW